MKDLTIAEINELKNSKKSIVLIWAEGCQACETTKPFFEELPKQFAEFDFYKLKYTPEIMPFYENYIPKEEVQTQAKYDNGDLIVTVDNKPLMITTQESPILFPNFLFFTNEIIEENNQHGFVGNIPGFNKEAVEYILNEMSSKSTQESICG